MENIQQRKELMEVWTQQRFLETASWRPISFSRFHAPLFHCAYTCHCERRNVTCWTSFAAFSSLDLLERRKEKLLFHRTCSIVFRWEEKSKCCQEEVDLLYNAADTVYALQWKTTSSNRTPSSGAGVIPTTLSTDRKQSREHSLPDHPIEEDKHWSR